MKKKKITAVLLAISVVGSSLLFSSVTEVDPMLEVATAITKKLFGIDEAKKEDESKKNKRQTIVSSYLQGLDGEQDYIISESISGGYAIFEKESMELIEYSAVGSSPFNAIAGDYRGYAGPNAYFEKEGEQFKDIHTKKKLSKEKGLQVATKIKDKIKTDRAERKEKLEKEKQELSQYKQTSTSKSQSPGPTGDAYVDANEYTVLSQVHVPDYQFFLGNNGHGYNAFGTCSTVAAQLLLAYNNWAKDGRLLNEENLSNGETIFLPGRNNKEQEPYSQERIGTTSSFDQNDGTTSFYETLLGYINPKALEYSIDDTPSEAEQLLIASTTANTYNGIKDYLSSELSGYVIWGGGAVNEWDEIFTQTEENLQDKEIYISYSNLAILPSYTHAKIIDEINNGRPILAGILSYKEKTDGYEPIPHDVIVYGYQTIMYDNQQIDGFIAHFGWGNKGINWDALIENKSMDKTHVWFNSSWAYRFISFAVGHEHSDVAHPNNNHILKCSTCNRTTTTEIHTPYKAEQIVSGDIVNNYYHNRFCACGYLIDKFQHMYEYYPNYVTGTQNAQHRCVCNACGYETYINHWDEDNVYYERWGSTQHKKFCICAKNAKYDHEKIVVYENHVFKNGKTCAFCGEVKSS